MRAKRKPRKPRGCTGHRAAWSRSGFAHDGATCPVHEKYRAAVERKALAKSAETSRGAR